MTEVVAPPLVRLAHEDARAYVGAPARHRQAREAGFGSAPPPGATRRPQSGGAETDEPEGLAVSLVSGPSAQGRRP